MDPIDEARIFVAKALHGDAWEVRDNYPYVDGEKCWIERGVGRNRERFIETPLTSLEACKIERLLEVARGRNPWADPLQGVPFN